MSQASDISTPAETNVRAQRKSFAIRSVLIVSLSIVVFFVALSLAISGYMILSTRNDVHTISQIEQADMTADACVVLGASVFADGTPSDMLSDRLEVAADLYFAGVVPVIIVSGDNRSAHYNESDAMKDYCVALGVPSRDVLVDHAGYDTYASIYRARYVYGAESIMVVTQAYHLYRALAIAQGLGMTACGVPADKGVYEDQTAYSCREILARNKDFFQTLFGIPPEDIEQPITRYPHGQIPRAGE